MRIARQQPGEMLITAQGFAIRCAPSQRMDIGFDSMGEHSRHQSSVRRLEHASKWRSEAMHDAEAGVCERHPSEEAGKRHRFSRVPVVSIVKGTQQRDANAL